MANAALLVPKIKKWEGGFVNDPADPGGATMAGITLETYTSYCKVNGLHAPSVDDLKNISAENWMAVFKTMFWNHWCGDMINSQSNAEILVDWYWASGSYAITIPQKLLNVGVDGAVGPGTIKALNNYPDQAELHQKLYDARMSFIDRIVAHSVSEYDMKMLQDQGRHASQAELMHFTFLRFQAGWKNRIDDSYKIFVN